MSVEPTWSLVLVVDDDEHARNLLADTLGRRGYDTIAASSNAAVHLARSAKPGLVILDVDELARAHALATELRAQPGLEEAFIVAITDGERRMPPGDSVVDEYMHKPVAPTTIAAVLQRRSSLPH